MIEFFFGARSFLPHSDEIGFNDDRLNQLFAGAGISVLGEVNMGVKISGVFKGGLAMAMTHDLSKTQIITDPPLDNGGEGKSFSPTDLVATSLGACMMSVMALYAKKAGISLMGMACSVEKHMSADLPRRISGLDAVIIMPKSLTEAQRADLERIGNSCPVIMSIHPDIKLTKTYKYEA